MGVSCIFLPSNLEINYAGVNIKKMTLSCNNKSSFKIFQDPEGDPKNYLYPVLQANLHSILITILQEFKLAFNYWVYDTNSQLPYNEF